ncbi:Glycoprotein 3-alpha-L-fucosyltransferase A [Spatholobus suberectus]|nr:Glycoprotein 3-alpha-L-fucosyltransferase A [Spatholobus suberectus]
MLSRIQGTLTKSLFLFLEVTRSGSRVRWDVNLALVGIRNLMLHLGYLNQVEQQAFCDRWNQHNTMLRTILPWQDGGRGYSIVMTTSLSSDVPVGYFSWAEYDIMAPMKPKTESALAAAFISNCGARNFRLQALEALEKSNTKIDSYGGCHRNRDGRVDKVEALKHYKFSLAFENSNEEDYVTEKFFQSLVAGTVPVVVGAPNIQDFAPSPGSILHIKELEDVESVAKSMRYLAENPEAYNQSLRWKFEGPSDSFKALVDMAAVHSSCRLCIHLATVSREKEENSPGFKKRPCKCTRGSKTVYHVYVRERGRFEMESIYLRSSNLTLEALKSAVVSKFTSLNHVPIWKTERPEVLRRSNDLKLYRIYPVGLTQRQALYTFSFKGDADFRSHLESNPCAKFEVIFV